MNDESGSFKSYSDRKIFSWGENSPGMVSTVYDVSTTVPMALSIRKYKFDNSNQPANEKALKQINYQWNIYGKNETNLKTMHYEHRPKQ